MPHIEIIVSDALEALRKMPDESVHCCVTSPPYWGLRDYGTATWEGGDPTCKHLEPQGGPSEKQESSAGTRGLQYKRQCPCGARRIDSQLGLEQTPEEYVAKMVDVFREVKRVLRNDGTLWLNLGDSYAGSWGAQSRPDGKPMPLIDGSDTLSARQIMAHPRGTETGSLKNTPGLKAKDMVGIPWRVAFALQADGWYLRSDIIWCLSGGTWLYVWTKDSGECLMTVKDLFRIKDRSPMLWTGDHWSSLLGMSKSPRLGIELEIVLRSGERISCTPTHQFPVHGRGVIKAMDIRIGDSLTRCKLPEPYPVEDGAIDEDAAWLAGLYLAEGSRSGDTIQIAGHAKEDGRWKACHRISKKFGGTATRTVSGNTMDIRIYGRVINAIIDELICGRTAHDKGFAPAVWRHSNRFVDAMLRGYLSGDGHWEPANKRFRLGFCRNYNLERDLRTACARLGYHLSLKLSTVAYQGRRVPTFRGELRMERTGHRNEKNSAEVIAIRKARCRDLYDIGVAHEPHLFALASGILTHNSKPNPMPESVTDRPTKAHEYLFLLSKSPRYYYDADAVREPLSPSTLERFAGGSPRAPSAEAYFVERDGGRKHIGQLGDTGLPPSGDRNRRTVWTVPTAPYPEAHFATYPPDLIKPCILAGTSAAGCCAKCGAPMARDTEKEKGTPESFNGSSFNTGKTHDARAALATVGTGERTIATRTVGWNPTCSCQAGATPCTVLDPFGGSGTTGMVALELGRKAILIELNPKYAELARKRCDITPGLPLAV